jgi:hypothetical protein
MTWRSARRWVVATKQSNTTVAAGPRDVVNVISAPASDVSSWNKLRNTRTAAYCCVWTGRDDSPASEWFGKWKDNVWKAHRMGHCLIFVARWDGVLGGGQTKEFNWLRSREFGHPFYWVNTMMIDIIAPNAGGMGPGYVYVSRPVHPNPSIMCYFSSLRQARETQPPWSCVD